MGVTYRNYDEDFTKKRKYGLELTSVIVRIICIFIGLWFLSLILKAALLN